MKYLVPLILLFFTLAFWLAVDQNASLGRKPSDEELISFQEVNKVSGELYNVRVVRCKLCGQVLSYVQYHLSGKVAGMAHYTHHCGEYTNGPVVHYYGSDLGPKSFSLIAWLDKWQKLLRLKR